MSGQAEHVGELYRFDCDNVESQDRVLAGTSVLSEYGNPSSRRTQSEVKLPSGPEEAKKVSMMLTEPPKKETASTEDANSAVMLRRKYKARTAPVMNPKLMTSWIAEGPEGKSEAWLAIDRKFDMETLVELVKIRGMCKGGKLGCRTQDQAKEYQILKAEIKAIKAKWDIPLKKKTGVFPVVVLDSKKEKISTESPKEMIRQEVIPEISHQEDLRAWSEIVEIKDITFSKEVIVPLVEGVANEEAIPVAEEGGMEPLTIPIEEWTHCKMEVCSSSEYICVVKPTADAIDYQKPLMTIEKIGSACESKAVTPLSGEISAEDEWQRINNKEASKAARITMNPKGIDNDIEGMYSTSRVLIIYCRLGSASVRRPTISPEAAVARCGLMKSKREVNDYCQHRTTFRRMSVGYPSYLGRGVFSMPSAGEGSDKIYFKDLTRLVPGRVLVGTPSNFADEMFLTGISQLSKKEGGKNKMQPPSMVEIVASARKECDLGCGRHRMRGAPRKRVEDESEEEHRKKGVELLGEGGVQGRSPDDSDDF
jgi:hypothetical protein